MGFATFKELCLDTHPAPGQDASALGRFWAAATGCTFDGSDVVGHQEGMGIAICPVPEPRTVKHRVHLDVHTDDIATLTALGATVLRPQDAVQEGSGIRWTVLADPEGGEFCAFVRPPEKLEQYRTYELVVDSVAHSAITAWWGEVFGAEVHTTDDGDWSWLEDVPGMPFEAFVFGDVPEPKTVKNRWHWDVYGHVEDFLARGATLLWTMPRWTVLGDPEGNEFCVFVPPA